MRVIPTVVRFLAKILPGSLTSKDTSDYIRIASSPFAREVNAVNSGIKRYEFERDGHTGNRTLLRRNIHRLEKALTMRPRRAVFATDFIQETVAAFSKIVTHADDRSDTPHPNANTSRAVLLDIEYADAVLKTYFEVVDDVPETIGPRKTYQELSSTLLKSKKVIRDESSTRHVVPFQRPTEAPLIKIEQLKQLALHRRSVRWFEQKPVPRQLIDEALSIAIQAPSACNRQPFRFIVLDDPSAIAEVASIPMGTRGYEHQIPVFVIVVGQQRHFHDPRDRHVIYIDASLAVMGFLLAIETLALGACCINWPDIEAKERALQQKLGLDDDERPVMCLAIGWPLRDALVASSPKKELDELRCYNSSKTSMAFHHRHAA
jgi:nitroreductase